MLLYLLLLVVTVLITIPPLASNSLIFKIHKYATIEKRTNIKLGYLLYSLLQQWPLTAIILILAILSTYLLN